MKPYDWQITKIIAPLVRVFERENTAILAVDTGLGKTPTALWVAQKLGLTPFVISPQATLADWYETSKILGIPIITAINIEKLRYSSSEHLIRKGRSYTWQLDPNKLLLIFDEGHQFTGRESLSAEVLAATRKWVNIRGVAQQYMPKVLIMSATLADSPIKLGDAVGSVLGLHNRKSWDWLLQHGCYIDRYKKPAFPTGKGRLPHLKRLHEELFPKYGVALKHTDVPEFPKNQLFTELCELSAKDTREVQKLYDEYGSKEHELENEILEIKDKIKTTDSKREKAELEFLLRTKHGTKYLRACQKSEIAKVPQFIERAECFIAEGISPVIGTWFRPTLDAILDKMEKKHSPAVIRGGQSGAERTEAMRRFRADETRLCLVNIRAGGTGTNLNDIHGNFPRVTLSSPCPSVQDFVQFLGRIVRANNAEPDRVVLQYLLIAKGTIEEQIAARLEIKRTNITAITDASFWGEGKE